MRRKPWLETSFCRKRIACRDCRRPGPTGDAWRDREGAPETCPYRVTADTLPEPFATPATSPELCPAAGAACDHWRARKCHLDPADTRCLSDLRFKGPAGDCPLSWQAERAATA
ncbi:MAG: hypothetical protein PVJ57_17800 [Phycisphaerae bacterium]